MLTVNGVEPTEIKCNGVDLTEVICNGVVVWSSSFSMKLGGDYESQLNASDDTRSNRCMGVYVRDTSTFEITLSRALSYDLDLSVQLHYIKNQSVIDNANSESLAVRRTENSREISNTIKINKIPGQDYRVDYSNYAEYVNLDRTFGANLAHCCPLITAGQTFYSTNLNDSGSTVFYDPNKVFTTKSIISSFTVTLSDDFTIDESSWHKVKMYDVDDNEWGLPAVKMEDPITGLVYDVVYLDKRIDVPDDVPDEYKTLFKSDSSKWQFYDLNAPTSISESTTVTNGIGRTFSYTVVGTPSNISNVLLYNRCDKFRYVAKMGGHTYYAPWTSTYGYNEFTLS